MDCAVGAPVVPMHRKQPLRSSRRVGLGTWGRPAAGAIRAPCRTHERAENPYMLKRITLGRRIPAVAGAVIVVAIIGGGTATAANLITGKDIKNGSVGTADIKNGTLKVKDLTPKAVKHAAEARHRHGRCHRLGRRHGRCSAPAARRVRRVPRAMTERHVRTGAQLGGRRPQRDRRRLRPRAVSVASADSVTARWTSAPAPGTTRLPSATRSDFAQAMPCQRSDQVGFSVYTTRSRTSVVRTSQPQHAKHRRRGRPLGVRRHRRAELLDPRVTIPKNNDGNMVDRRRA